MLISPTSDNTSQLVTSLEFLSKPKLYVIPRGNLIATGAFLHLSEHIIFSISIASLGEYISILGILAR